MISLLPMFMSGGVSSSGHQQYLQVGTELDLNVIGAELDLQCDALEVDLEQVREDELDVGQQNITLEVV